jgi:hypothetical protein
MPNIEMLGRRFGRLVVVKELKKRAKDRCIRYRCRCDCGRNRVIVEGWNLRAAVRAGHSISCGCLRREKARTKRLGNGLRDFWKKVRAGSTPTKCSPAFGRCWDWTGTTDGGYGIVVIGSHRYRATHIAVYFATGDVPQGVVMHVCDNPSCVNPRHLIDGSARDNAYDRGMKRRGAVLIDALTAEAVPKAWQPNQGTEEKK